LKFSDKLTHVDWNNVYDSSNIDKKFSYFIHTFVSIFNDCFPLVKTLDQKKKKRPWVNEELKTLLEEVKLLKIISDFNPNFNHLYKSSLYSYNYFVDLAKKRFYSNKILNSDCQSRTIWKAVNDLTEHKSSKPKFSLNNCSQSDLPCKFNEFFLNSSKQVVASMQPSNNFQLSSIQLSKRSMFVNPITHSEVFNIVMSLKNKKSTGDDGIPVFVIKRNIYYILDLLVYLINQSFVEGVFPSHLKSAVVIPIFKKGDPHCLENYRPVSLLSSFTKIFEIAMGRRIIEFLRNDNILHSNQHGFLKGKSCETAIFQFLQKIIGNLESKCFALGIFVDLSKAFDVLNHDILISKCFRYGIRGVALDWLRSYLSDRIQKVAVRERGLSSESTYLPVTHGVPQGSVLGPLLFVIFINDLLNITNETPHMLLNYADDTNLLLRENDFPSVVSEAETYYSRLLDWFISNKLAVNNSKTNCTLFIAKNMVDQYPTEINLNSSVIKVSTQSKFLGVTIDCRLSWSMHIDTVCERVSRNLYTLRVLKSVLEYESLKVVYYANIYSHIRHGIIFWGSSSDTQRVFVLQKRALRILLHLGPRVSCRGLFRSNRLLTVYAIYIFSCLLFHYKNRGLFANETFTHSYDTRNKDDYRYPSHRLEIYKNSCFYKCIYFYNCLPETIRNCQTLNSFKNSLFKLLCCIEPYTVNEFVEYLS